MRINGKSFKTNVAAGLFSQSVSILFALVCLPVTLKTLGEAKFGTIVFIISIMGLMGMLDAGLGRATTKIVAEDREESSPERAASFFWAAIGVQFALGLVFVTAAWIYLRWTAIVGTGSFGTVAQARELFVSVAPCLPFLVTIGSLRGALEGKGRFVTVAVIKGLQNSSLYLIPALMGFLDFSLLAIVTALTISRVVCAFLYFLGCLNCFGSIFRFKLRLVVGDLGTLRFIGWLSVSSVAVAMLTNLDRLILGGVAGPEELAVYALCMEIVAGIGLLPGAISTVLLPRFSEGSVAPEKLAASLDLLLSSLRAVCLGLLPIVLVIVFQGQFLLDAWQGAAFAEKAHWVFIIGALAAFANALGWIPTTLLIGSGRANAVALIQLGQLPFQLVLLFYFSARYGAKGAMAVFFARVMAETIAFFWALGRIRALFGLDYGFRPVVRALLHDWRIVCWTTPILLIPKIFRADAGMTGVVASLIGYGIVFGWLATRTLRQSKEKAVTGML